jgi:uncharacterized protein YegL
MDTTHDQDAELVPYGAPAEPDTVHDDARTPALLNIVVADTSLSMGPLLGQLQSGLRNLGDGLLDQPQMAEIIWTSFLSFDGTARALTAPARLSDPATAIPTLQLGAGGTNFTAAFELARSVVDEQLTVLRDQGHQPYRPTVWFMSDGFANVGGNWKPARDRLADSTWERHPNILAFGWGQAERAEIEAVTNVDGGAYFAADGASPAEVVAAMVDVMMRSFVASSQAAGTATGAAPAQPGNQTMVQITPVR